MPPENDVEIKVRRGDNWTRICAEAKGKDVSHLQYAPFELQLGAGGTVRMAGIGGVGTSREFRRRGLGQRVFERTMEQAAEEGHYCMGLYTSRRIVAHRLYRRFGFVDTARRKPLEKLLDPGRFTCKKLSDLVPRNSALRRWRATLRLDLPPHPAFHVQIEEGDVRVLDGEPEEVQLSLTMPSAAFVGICRGDISVRYAEAAKLLSWDGDPDVYRALAESFASGHPPVNEE